MGDLLDCPEEVVGPFLRIVCLCQDQFDEDGLRATIRDSRP